jgi:hypothetical protein
MMVAFGVFGCRGREPEDSFCCGIGVDDIEVEVMDGDQICEGAKNVTPIFRRLEYDRLQCSAVF